MVLCFLDSLLRERYKGFQREGILTCILVGNHRETSQTSQSNLSCVFLSVRLEVLNERFKKSYRFDLE